MRTSTFYFGIFLILFLCLGPPSSALTQEKDKIKIETSVVSILISVTDPEGRFVTGLKQEHFMIFEDKIKQEIDFFSDEDAPISLGIVFDVSGSMKERVPRAIKALRRFIETSHDDDDIFLIGFNNKAELVQDFTTSGDQILNHLIMIIPKGSTALYDATYLAAEKVQQGRHKKKALLIISDGQDNHSRYTYKELRNLIREADIQIYAIGITDPNDELNANGRSILGEIARMTGGRSFFPSASNEPELTEIFTRIALELRYQYSVGYYAPHAAHDGKCHKIKIVLGSTKGLGKLSLKFKDKYCDPKM